MTQTMNIDAGAGEFWLHRPTTGSNVDVTAAFQRRITGDIEALVVVTAELEKSNLDESAAAAILASDPLPTTCNSQVIRGVWHRIPGALKRPAKLLWHRRLLPQHQEQIRITLPPLGIDDEVTIPADLPTETSIQNGLLATSGLLRLSWTSVLRVSISNADETSANHRLRLSSSAAATKAVLYFNGPDGWLDGIIVFEGSAEHLPLHVDTE